MLKLIPIHIDEDKTLDLYANPYCRAVFESYPAYYHKTGYHPPWIGYFVIRDNEVVGVGGFVGQPTNGRVEIAYGTRKDCEGQGIAGFTCRALVEISKANDPTAMITAKTAPATNASASVLKKNGFEYTGIVQDDGIGDAWEWIYKKSI